jgi:hypothetical protein
VNKWAGSVLRRCDGAGWKTTMVYE